MPLSKRNNRERMRQSRLHGKENTGYVQPRGIYNMADILTDEDADNVASQMMQRYIDADGNPIPND